MRALVRSAFAASMLLATAHACTDEAQTQPSPGAGANLTAAHAEAPHASSPAVTSAPAVDAAGVSDGAAASARDRQAGG